MAVRLAGLGAGGVKAPWCVGQPAGMCLFRRWACAQPRVQRTRLRRAPTEAVSSQKTFARQVAGQTRRAADAHVRHGVGDGWSLVEVLRWGVRMGGAWVGDGFTGWAKSEL